LLDAGATNEELELVEKRVAEQIDEAVEFAKHCTETTVTG
jgi:TPP-dependent pyruvate/acetoin dehydrogenase alpha subunit